MAMWWWSTAEDRIGLERLIHEWRVGGYDTLCITPGDIEGILLMVNIFICQIKTYLLC